MLRRRWAHLHYIIDFRSYRSKHLLNNQNKFKLKFSNQYIILDLKTKKLILVNYNSLCALSLRGALVILPFTFRGSGSVVIVILSGTL